MRTNHPKGFIEWKIGTGGNHEITQIKAYEQRKGVGRELIKLYLEKAEPPFYSVYAFVLGTRTGARNFYKSMGFREIVLGKSIYKDDVTILVWAVFKELKNIFQL